MARRRRQRNGNPIGGVFLLIAGGVALVGSLFSGKPAPPPSLEIPAVIQPAAPNPQITSPAPETAPAPAPQPAWRNVWISGHKVPIRSEPAAIAPIVDRVDNGLLVVEYERRGGWVLIEHPVTAKRGWGRQSGSLFPRPANPKPNANGTKRSNRHPAWCSPRRRSSPS